MTVALDQLSQVRAPRSPRTTVLPDPTVLAPLARTRSGARSSRRPEGTRSEERRVGKECRYRRAPEDENRKKCGTNVVKMRKSHMKDYKEQKQEDRHK